MTKQKIPPQERATQLVEEALATGVRGEARRLLKAAQDELTGNKPLALTQMHYDKIREGDAIRDPDRPGLVMRHGKRTGRVWFFDHRDPVTGKKTVMEFGRYPDTGLADARSLWAEMRDRVQSGKAAIDQEKEEGSILTIEELVEKYLVEYARPHKRSHAMDETYLRKHLVPGYGNIPATDLTQDDVRKILKPISERTPREAEKVRGVMSSMFNIAIRGSRKLGNVDGGTWLPAGTANPVTFVTLAERSTQSHTATEKELRALVRHLATGAMDMAGDALLLQLQTCSRVSEVAEMPWSEVDFDAGEWLLPAERSKNGHAHKIMLPTQSLALLAARRKADPDSVFVFPTRGRLGHYNRNAASKAIAKLRKTLDLDPHFVTHSFRHGCMTWLAEQGCGKEIRDRISNHIEGTGKGKGRGSDAVYIRKAEMNGPAREWLQRWADYLDSLRGDTVVSLHGAAS